jgi:SAM-dependent methyltransferase
MSPAAMHDAPFYPAAEQNREPILAVLRQILVDPGLVLEIGSGSGQHAVHFAAQLPHLEWQPTDLPEQLPGIDRWRTLTGLANVRPPLALDLNDDAWPVDACAEAYSANTAHVLPWVLVERMLAGVARRLRPGGRFCLYGPFRYGDRHTSESNATFDAALRRGDPQRGVRDTFRLEEYGLEVGLVLGADHAMPVNNRLLVFERRPD